MIHLRLWPFYEDTVKPNGDYSVWQLQCLHYHIISQSQDFQHWSCSPYKFHKTWSTSFHSHVDLAWLCNLRFDYSKKAFEGFAWLHIVWLLHQCHHREICNSWLQKSPIQHYTKIMLMRPQVCNVLVVFVLCSTTVRKVNLFFYMWVMGFKIINKHCLNLIQEACK